MNCPQCGSSAPALAGRCPVCGCKSTPQATVATSVLTPTPTGTSDSEDTRLPPPFDSDITHLAPPRPSGGSSVPPSPTGTAQTPLPSTGPLTVGQNFGSRYHIIRLLGTGGMGSVYQAWDQELEVAVAVKVIRPDVTADPLMAQDLERRFKRELLLARQVTDKHVVRIHDIGEISGIKYITMPYIQGSDLATILKREGRLALDRALSIAQQVATGLIAAHDAGVVHRDLKPANIMVDESDHAVIMDFGIARSTSGATAFAMTVGAQVIGTVEYMAPEQAKAETVDQRADLYAFGLILRDMLLGGRHAGSTSGVTELMGRIQHPPPGLRSIDPTIPDAVEALVTRCLEPDPAARYQTARDLVRDIERVAAGQTPAIKPFRAKSFLGSQPAWRWILAACVLVAVAVGAWFLRDRSFRPPQAPQQATTAGPTITLAILPFRNASGDPTLDSLGSSLSQVLSTTLGQSSHVRTVPPDRLNQVLRDLQIGSNATLAPAQLASVANFTTARRVLWGTVTRFGNQIRIDATLQDLDRQETVPLNALAPNEGSLLTAISQLADSVRQSLARGSVDILEELKSTSWKPSTSSFEALRLYNEGLQLTQQGTHQEALKRYEAATKADPNFALGFSGLALGYSNLGYDDKAAQASRQAMSLSEALPPQEKHRIAANHYRIANDTDKAIEAYEKLVSASPGDAVARFELGTLYEQNGALDEARQHFSKVVELDPKFIEGLLALGRVEIKQGNPQPSLEPLEKALGLATQLENNEARANIQQAIGIAYMRLNRPSEALSRYKESLEIKKRLGNKRGMAASHVQIGEVQKTLGTPGEAEKSFREALRLRREIGDRAGISTTLIDLSSLLDETFGRSKEALPLLLEALDIARETGNKNLEARALNNLGAAYLAQGQYSDAQTNFESALAIREKAKAPQEAADTLHNLGDTFTKMGRYDQALRRYMSALELRRTAGDRRNAALASYGMGTIFDYQGRYGSAVKSQGEALQAFRDLKQQDIWLGEILSAWGNSLNLSGRMRDAQAPLEEALKLAKGLKNVNLIAQTLRFQADSLYYAGDVKGASQMGKQVADASRGASDRSLALLAQADTAIIASTVQPTKALAAQLADVAQEADMRGLKSLSVECLVQRADTLIKLGDTANGFREADRALARAEALGLKVPLAKAYYLKGSVLRAKGDSSAWRDYAAALRLLEEVKSDGGNENVLKRADLAPIHAECVKWSKGP
jgi:serine/threonine protein kinase/tetratricopeptide (TPR) repeat protein